MLFHYYTVILITDPQYVSCLCSGDTNNSLDISLACSFVAFSILFCGKVFETFITLSATFLPIKLPVASTGFSIALFVAVSSGSVADSLAWSISFLFKFWYKFSVYHSRLPKCIYIRFLACFTFWLITRVMFFLSSVYSGLKFWSVNLTSISENSELNVFKNFWMKYLIIDLRKYWKQM